MRRALWGFPLALVALASVPGLVWAGIQSDASTVDGIRVEGHRLDSTENPRPAIRRLADAWLNSEIGVQVQARWVRTSRRELGALVDVERVIDAVQQVAKTGDLFEDLTQWWEARTGGLGFQWDVSYDSDALRTFAQELQPLTTGNATLDVDKTVNHLREALFNDVIVVEAVVEEPVRPAAEPPPTVATRVVISSFVTDFGTRETNRCTNVERAAKLLDGAVIPAFGEFSFNDRIGERSYRNGFRMAHEIRDGVMVDGMGGGVCQVASTLHAAAYLGGMTMTEHVPHSRPSSYISLGLDATVSWPSVDLRIRNPWAEPVHIRARANMGQLRVDLIGSPTGLDVDWESRVLSRSPFEDRIVEDPELGKGMEEVEQEGILGVRIERTRFLRDRFGAEQVEREMIRYPPTDRVIRIGLGMTPDFSDLETTPLWTSAPGESAARLPRLDPAW